MSRYWKYPDAGPGREGLSTTEFAEHLVSEVEESVRLRLMSDVPLGVMLSGGLDSSFIASLMARNMTESLKTFSVGFAEAGDANELSDAREMASILGADHHELELSMAETVRRSTGSRLASGRTDRRPVPRGVPASVATRRSACHRRPIGSGRGRTAWRLRRTIGLRRLRGLASGAEALEDARDCRGPARTGWILVRFRPLLRRILLLVYWL